jgi:hypothetical protein
MLRETPAAAVARWKREWCPVPSMTRNPICVAAAREELNTMAVSQAAIRAELERLRREGEGGTIDGLLAQSRPYYGGVSASAVAQLVEASVREGSYTAALRKRGIEPKPAAARPPDEIPRPYDLALAAKRQKEEGR